MLFFRKKQKKKNVLIVEDDALLCRALSDAFSAAGHHPVCIDNGLKVKEEITKRIPDVILLDLILPGIDGFTVLKQLKSESKTASIPVAVISNLDSVADVKSVKSLGAEVYFIKANTDIQEILGFINQGT